MEWKAVEDRIVEDNFPNLTILWLPPFCYRQLSYDPSVYPVFVRTKIGYFTVALHSTLKDSEVLLSSLNVI